MGLGKQSIRRVPWEPRESRIRKKKKLKKKRGIKEIEQEESGGKVRGGGKGRSGQEKDQPLFGDCSSLNERGSDKEMVTTEKEIHI